MSDKANWLMKFEDTEVEIIEIDGEPYFEVYGTGMALGQVKSVVRNVQTYKYPFKERIDKNLESAGIEPRLRGANKYINEAQLYDFMLEMRTDKCKPFRKWVTTEVLPNLRRTGTYSLSGAQQPVGYPHKASSMGEAATMIKTLDKIMIREKQSPEAIARMAEGICQSCGIPLPPDFVKREQEPLQQLALVGVFWTEQS